MLPKAVLAGGVLLVLAGCRANPYHADVSGRVLYESRGLAHLITVQTSEADRIEGGLLRVRANLKNDTRDDLWVDVQTVWKQNGFEKYRTSWAPLMLPARFEQTYEVASLNADVDDYELRFRKPTRTEE
ncbi:MAG: hypothetical protein AB1716_01200 [Planctomycetota bacterium]